jgi:hypothetical protein
MSMERMDIRLYGATHEKDVRIQLATALYHMPSQILSSETRSRVSREDFDLQGDSMIFDTRTGQGKMTGRVRMVIYDSDSFSPQGKSAPATGNEKPAETDKPAGNPSAAPSPPPPSTPPSHEKK